MAGARIELQYVDAGVQDELKRLLARLEDPQPALAEIGQYGVESTRERIESQNADNPIAAWEPLTERYLKSKRKREHHPDEILVLYGFLVSTFAWQATKDTVEWGSNQVYAAAQQFGRPEINLPPRPFLGVTERDRTEILDILHAWLSDAA